MVGMAVMAVVLARGSGEATRWSNVERLHIRC